ncbi:MAG: dipeptide epimerase [Bacteroidota bacterium]
MKIREIRVRKEALDLTRPYTIAYKTVKDVAVCYVEVIAENGLIGRGAANPSQQVVGETVDQSVAALSSEALQTYIGRDIRELRLLCETLHQQFPSHPGAKAALDIAFHDLFAQVIGVPLVDYLGRHHHQLATSITIGIKKVAETLEEAQEYVDRKFRILKVKLGHSLEEDLERLIKLRERFGDRLGIRVDANQGYSFAELLSFHERSQQLDIELIEQPLPVSALAEMQGLPPAVKARIAADESLVNAEDAFQLTIPPHSCGIFNIKLMKCGGIYQAQRIAEMARQAGFDLMWGCNDESIISIAAGLHIAFSCPHTRYIDLDGSLDLARDLVKGGFVLEEGMMRTLDKPGLGVEAL